VTTVLKTWRSFRRLTGPEKRVALEAAALLSLTWMGIRVAGYRRWKHWIESSRVGLLVRGIAAEWNCKGSLEKAVRLARLRDAAARHLPVEINCLENSLALYWLLRRHEIPASLRMGARKIDSRLEAHAWLECEGAVVGDNDHLRFAPFDGLNAPLESQIH
jgi:hypothetical protein